MKIVFTHISTEHISGQPPLGIGYLASYIRKYTTANVSIVDQEKNILKAIKREKPDVLGISSVTMEYKRAIKLAKQVKEQLDIPIILGGNHVTIMPNTITNDFDVGVIGEGEETLAELLVNDLSNLDKIKGICYRKDGKLHINERRPLINPLDKIPYPARDLFDMEHKYLVPRRAGTAQKLSRATHLFTSRGCPFNCVFCSSSHFWQRRLRMFSPEYVIGEMKELVDKYKVEEILIFDDLFAANLERLKKIVRYIKEEKINEKVDFGCLSRVDIFDEQRAKLLKEMNVLQIDFGFESGSQRILNYLKNNTTTVEQNKRAAELAHKYGLKIHGFFMIGAPMETKEDMLKTLKFIKNTHIDTVTLCVVTPYPGTQLWEEAKQRGLVSDNMDWRKLDLTPKNDNFVYMNTQMSKQEFMEIYKDFKKQIEKNQYAIDFRFRDLLSPFVIKYALSHPVEAWKHFYHSIKKKLNNKY
ncbi:MAG: B12-binding domain-containing radical SAM protein [Candidatus Aenigmarchaeota archaeon]|nr:B12-binding domain-containing radical SAM protein [Candidatus Aenigmarchaeota archaeon]